MVKVEHKDMSARARTRRKWQRFADEYLVDMNAKQAALRAGFLRNSASELLQNRFIQKAVEEGLERRSKEVAIQANDVIRELRHVAFSDIYDYVTWDDGNVGVKLRPSQEITPQARKAIRRIKTKPGGEVEIELFNKLDALEKIAKHLGMYIERKDYTVRVTDERLLTDDDLIRIIESGSDRSADGSDGDAEPSEGSNGVSRVH